MVKKRQFLDGIFGAMNVAGGKFCVSIKDIEDKTHFNERGAEEMTKFTIGEIKNKN